MASGSPLVKPGAMAAMQGMNAASPLPPSIGIPRVAARFCPACRDRRQWSFPIRVPAAPRLPSAWAVFPYLGDA